jgi:exosortase N
MGLNMLHVALILGLFILAYLERFTQKRLNFWQVFLALSFLTGLNIISNLLRIILLAIFQILPAYTMHEVVGLLCFLGYVLVPFYFAAQVLFRYLPNSKATSDKKTFITRKTAFVLNILLLLGIATRAICLPDAQRIASLADIPCNLPGYTKTKLAAGVIQFQKPDALVYVKPVDSFYRPEHTPLICWTGNGYLLEKIKEQACAGYTIYTGILRKNQDLLYTAWWFDNGQIKTNEQLKWRTHMLAGSDNYSLVNVSAETEQDLLKEAAAILKRNIFQP